jgi:hypothetical protein
MSELQTQPSAAQSTGEPLDPNLPTPKPLAAQATPTTPVAEAATLYCANHPDVETLLRCNRCGKPICLKCAQLTDVGYRCKECIRGVQAAYFNAVPLDNVIAFGVALVVTALAAPVAGFVFRLFGLFIGLILAFMMGGAAGGILAQIIRTAVSKRRGRQLRYFALAGIVLGVLIGSLIGGIILGIPMLSLILSIGMLVFTVLAATAAYQILR